MVIPTVEAEEGRRPFLLGESGPVFLPARDLSPSSLLRALTSSPNNNNVRNNKHSLIWSGKGSFELAAVPSQVLPPSPDDCAMRPKSSNSTPSPIKAKFFPYQQCASRRHHAGACTRIYRVHRTAITRNVRNNDAPCKKHKHCTVINFALTGLRPS